MKIFISNNPKSDREKGKQQEKYGLKLLGKNLGRETNGIRKQIWHNQYFLRKL